MAECFGIRMRVFVEEQGVPLDEELDEDDIHALHYLVRDGEIPAAAARLVPKSDGVAKVGRVAVLPSYRRQGVGTKLMTYILDGDARSYEEVILDSQLTAVGFYERLGFVAEGDEFLDAGIPHIRMRFTVGAQ
mgnify:CR=1 FL=1